MRVDVIIPCHNGARYLGEALESVLRQTHDATAALVIDDGSTDASVEIARGFGHRVTVLRQAKSGVSAARNRGIDAARGDCVAFLDADDRWHPEKVARQLAFLADHPECGLVHTAIRHIDAAGLVTGRPHNIGWRRQTRGECLSVLLARNTITTSSVLLRREIVRDERFLTGLHAAEDWDLWLRLASRTPLGYIDQELTDYRFHDSNTVRQAELMLAGELTVIDRALSRLRLPAHRRAAQERRRRVLAALGAAAYEREDMARARHFFGRAGRPADSEGLVRYVAAWLPRFVRRPVRVCWRRYHSGVGTGM
jgi:glycosyltransferase involved in cell wall biosynthesis